jgi:hypothetical protein
MNVITLSTQTILKYLISATFGDYMNVKDSCDLAFRLRKGENYAVVFLSAV